MTKRQAYNIVVWFVLLPLTIMVWAQFLPPCMLGWDARVQAAAPGPPLGREFKRYTVCSFGGECWEAAGHVVPR